MIAHRFAQRMARGLIKPISLLLESVENLAAGNTGQDLPVESKDEQDNLAKSFKKMRASLERRNMEVQHLEKARDNSAIVAITDAVGKIIHVNDKFCGISKYSREELLGHDHRIINSGYHSKEFMRDMWITIRRGEVWHGIVCNRKKDGQVYWVDTTITPFFSKDGKPEHYVAIRFEVTQLKNVENELVSARDKALSAAKMKAEFLANMSHEIRTPMNGVIGMTQLLDDTDLDAEQKDYVETIRSSGDSLLGIINDILDFSKMESGRMTLEKIAFEPREVVENVLQTFSPQARSKTVELTQFFPEDIPRILLGDPNRFRQVVTNLVGNALKFTEKGEIEVHARGPGANDPKDLYRFEVIDTGVGMTKEQEKNLFKAFVQADTSTTRNYGGTGLGLVISKHIVELFEGEVGAKSVLGMGSNFWFTGKFGSGDASTQVGKPEGFDRLKGLRSLVIDDNETNRKVLLQCFANCGFEGTAAENGAVGLKKFRESVREGKPFDVIALDYHMPDMNGPTVLREIRAMPQGGSPRILIATSGAENMRTEMLAAGANRYFLKPVRQAIFIDTLAELFLGEAGGKAPVISASVKADPASKVGKVLVAEDNPVNQKVISKILSKMGYQFEVVPDGKLAIERYSEGGVRIILMDCQMPRMDGYEAARTIRKIEGAGNRIPIIAVTASALNEDRGKAFAAGMDDYVTKPINKKNLESTLFRWMKEGVQVMTDQPDRKTIDLRAQEILPTPFDESAILKQTEGDREFAKELVQIFLDSSELLLIEMDKSFARGDAQALQAAAHSIKGSVGNFGAPETRKAAHELELMAERNDLIGASEKLETLKQKVTDLGYGLRLYVSGATS